MTRDGLRVFSTSTKGNRIKTGKERKSSDGRKSRVRRGEHKEGRGRRGGEDKGLAGGVGLGVDAMSGNNYDKWVSKARYKDARQGQRCKNGFKLGRQI